MDSALEWRALGAEVCSGVGGLRGAGASRSRFHQNSRVEPMAPEAAAAFPKAARLRRRAEFLAVQKTGVRWQSRSFVVICRASATERTRLGITVSRRVGNAVVRNRVKRMIREVFRTSQRHPSPAQDFLVIARSGANRLEYKQVASELGGVFQSSGTPH